MRNLTEQQIRNVIRQEIKSYLLEQEKKEEDNKLKSKFKKIITPTAIALLSFLKGTTFEPSAQAQTPIEETPFGELEEIIDSTKEALIKIGATDQYAQSLISRTVEYGNIEFESYVRKNAIKDKERPEEYEKFMLSKFNALQNTEALSNVAAHDFLTQAQSIGTHQIVSSNVGSGGETKVASPVPAYALKVAFANEMLAIVEEEEKQGDQFYTNQIIKSFDKTTQSYSIEPTELPFFKQVAEEGSEFQQAILSIIPQVSVPANIFNEEQTDNAMERINKAVGAIPDKKVQENKVNELRQRLNELRGVYV